MIISYNGESLWDLINFDDYCEEVSSLYNVDVLNVRKIILKAIKEAKKENSDNLTCLLNINDMINKSNYTRVKTC